METKKILLRNNQVEVNYYQAGSGKINLLFMHGWGIHGLYWKAQIDYFQSHFSVYAIDLPGFGQSKAAREDWTAEEYATDILHFIRELHLHQVVLVGHSMAGNIMLETAIQNNRDIIATVGVDNFKLIDLEITNEQKEQIGKFDELFREDFIHAAPRYAELALFHPTTPRTITEQVKSDFAAMDAVIGYNSFVNNIRFMADVAVKLEQLPHKLYLINTDAVPTHEAGLINRCSRGYRIFSIQQCGHYPMVEKPEKFNSQLESILAQIL